MKSIMQLSLTGVPLLIPIMLNAQAHESMSSRLPPPQPTRTFTMTLGLGNSMGWLGMQGERYFHAERLSVFAGIGYIPSTDADYDSGVALAFGLRGYTPGRHHRGFLELSFSQLAVAREPFEDDLYGPGLQAGYQLATSGGFTIMASLGAGYAIDAPSGASRVDGTFGLGFGYTWRRQRR